MHTHESLQAKSVKLRIDESNYRRIRNNLFRVSIYIYIFVKRSIIDRTRITLSLSICRSSTESLFTKSTIFNNLIE